MRDYYTYLSIKNSLLHATSVCICTTDLYFMHMNTTYMYVASARWITAFFVSIYWMDTLTLLLL